MFVKAPDHWKEVGEIEFVEFLATANDYIRDGYCGAVVYSWRHNQKRFAVVERVDGVEKIYVDPALMAKE